MCGGFQFFCPDVLNYSAFLAILILNVLEIKCKQI